MKKLVFIISVMLFSTGCISKHTIMVNDQGHAINCSASGWGWAGAPMAAIHHSRCIEIMKDRGYRVKE